jgi:hypothetical protein
VKQRDPELLLQALDLVRQRGLGDADGRGGAGEMPMDRNRVDTGELAKFDNDSRLKQVKHVLNRCSTARQASS